MSRLSRVPKKSLAVLAATAAIGGAAEQGQFDKYKPASKEQAVKINKIRAEAKDNLRVKGVVAASNLLRFASKHESKRGNSLASDIGSKGKNLLIRYGAHEGQMAIDFSDYPKGTSAYDASSYEIGIKLNFGKNNPIQEKVYRHPHSVAHIMRTELKTSKLVKVDEVKVHSTAGGPIADANYNAQDFHVPYYASVTPAKIDDLADNALNTAGGKTITYKAFETMAHDSQYIDPSVPSEEKLEELAESTDISDDILIFALKDIDYTPHEK